ncbi:phage tail protein [Psychrobacter sp. PAMC 21119]|uniref:phage tail-collar fiber domain-containing protein n=1 Tax=Psychrobacter sp. PAMC 21119 TaxID=1112209 RepID=UPI0002884DBE|nr:phage tail protein [Psychrobacter sp. PAMC 21119]
MATNPKPIIFKVTEAGKQAALSANAGTPKVQISLSQVAIGIGKYTPTGNETSLKSEIMKGPIVSGDIERASNTLRFSSDITSPTTKSIYEVGLFTDTGILFAVAASEDDALFTVHPDITFVMSYGLSLKEVDAENITVTTDPNGALSLVIMENHLAAPDPHPQYLNKTRFQMAMQALYPFGYQHHTHIPVNPKPLFDDILGLDTAWRRVTGKIFVSSDPSDPFINDYGIVLGQRGITDLAASGARPHVYPLQTTHTFERYDPEDNIETVWKVVANKTAINEGSTVRFTITANNLPDGQILNLSVKEGVLNASSNDITTPEKSDNSTVILRNGQAVIDFTTTPDDHEEEAQKHVRLIVGAPANLSLNVPITDAGYNETVVHITQSTNNGIELDEYYKQQSGSYPTATDNVRFIVDAGVDIVAPNTTTPAIVDGSKWPLGSEIIIENRGRILGRGGDGGRSAYKRKSWGSDGDILSTSKSLMRNPEAGGNGGTSVKALTTAIVVENYNIVAAGGGGGGGLGAYKTGGSAGYVIGGGGTGGGAPFGQRSPNESTYTMYLQDDAVTDLKLPLPESGFYAILFQRVAGSLANTSGSEGDYYYPSEYTASDIEETRAINLELSTTSTNSRASTGFSKYRIFHSAGYALNGALQLKMSQSANLNNKGLGGANLAASVTDSDSATSSPYPEGDDATLTRGGNGGDFGESGESGHFDKLYLYTGDQATDATPADMNWYIPPASGGLAGYAKEGNVTITNFGSGTTKGR